MSSFLYFCPNCNKLYKAGEQGKKLKCSQCLELAIDMGISDEDYIALGKEQKQELKDRIIRMYTGDAEPEYEDPGSGSYTAETSNPETSEPETSEPETSEPDASGSGTYETKGPEPEIVQPSGSNVPDADVPSYEPEERSVIPVNSRVGKLLKLLSKIGLVLTLIGTVIIAFVFTDEIDGMTAFAYAFTFALFGALLNLAVMGIGEICVLLSDDYA